ncbi:phenylalanine--tRNA ligase beta subunit-related protein [Candidatus Shikimatogenerans bostrichidophilus]|uniref:phenylalanine--tRNA ligase beta subunit-related protein n=1 Tax=Candidatus Shikimatogenerans bostrichidophilus TaxID=2943807 RepID=UPI0029675F05
MIFLLSWIKEFVYFNYNINNLFNNIGIEILSIKKIYPINYNYNKNIILGKIFNINKINNIYKIQIKTKNNKIISVYNKKYIKKNIKILIEKINNNYLIVCKENDYDYIIKTNIPHNISYLSYYYYLSREIYSYLKYNNIKTKIININKIKIKFLNLINFKIKSKNILYYNTFFIKNVKIIFSNFFIQKKLILSNIKPVNNIIDIKNIIIKEIGIPIEIIKLNNSKHKLIIKENNKNINFITENKNKIMLNKNIILYYNNFPIYYSNIINSYKNKIKINNKNNNLLICFSLYKKNKIRYIINKYNINNYITKIYNNIIILPNKYIYIYIFNKYLKILNININKINNVYYYKNYKIHNNIIKIKYSYIKKIIGIKISIKKILKILLILKYKIKFYNKKYIILINKNLFKNNINKKINIINDIIRFYGINNINQNKNNILINNTNYIYNKYLKIENIENKIINLLINYGFYQVINTPFIKSNELLNLKKKYLISLKDKTINKRTYLRNYLFIKMINNIIYNINRKINSIKIFEKGNIYIKKNNKIIEKKNIEILFTNKNKKYTLHYLYNILNLIIEKVGIKKYKKLIINNSKIFENKIILKYKNINIIKFGKLNNKYINNNIINQNIYLAIININNLFKIINYKINFIKYKPINKYQYFEKDLSFIIDNTIYFNNFNLLAKKQLKDKLINIYLIDIYKKNLPINKKSYTIRLIINNKYGKNKKYINNILLKLINLFKKKLNAKIKKII